MQVVCTGNRGSDLPESVLARSGNSEQAHFQLTVGGAYVVYAMATRNGNVGLLVLDDHGRPAWSNVELFDFLDASLPPHWSFTVRDEDVFGIGALWGYRSMIENPSHNDGLIERRRSAWKDFLDDNEWALREGPDKERMRVVKELMDSGRRLVRAPDLRASPPQDGGEP